MSFSFKKIHNSEHPKLGANIRGEFGESAVSALFVQLGFRVSHVQGDWYPYDMTVERHGQTYRVQVKTSTTSLGPNSYPSSEFSKTGEFDLAAIMTSDGSIFIIPKHEMSFEDRAESDRFKLYPKYLKFKAAQFKGFELSKSIEDLRNTPEWPRGSAGAKFK